MPYLFTPFHRLGADNTEVEGTGIGLTITKKLIEMMGGQIGVQSKINQGCTFWIELNLNHSSKNQPKKVENTQAITTLNHSKTHLLYIEDNSANRLLIKKIIGSKTNFQYHEAFTGEAGIKLALDIQPDIILLDINLPDINGYEVYQQLKTHPFTQSSKIIAVSANAMPNDIEKGQAEFCAYITKPINQQELLGTIKKILN